MLVVNNLSCGYGDITAVNKISFTVAPGEIFGLVGANGAGKTSTIMAIAGLISIHAGSVMLNEADITDVPAHLRINKGLALVPEGRRVFADLTVDENLTIGGARLDASSLVNKRSEVYGLFPQLKQRSAQQAGSLSGGEQQMLAIGRAVMAQPQLLLVDELSLGLMPTAIDECYEILRQLQQDGIAILLVEQNTERVLKAADHVAVVESGRIVWLGTGNEAQDESAIFDAYLGNL